MGDCTLLDIASAILFGSLGVLCLAAALAVLVLIIRDR